ncbi:MAG TPA: cytochrome P460 family protein [Candidatus Competibacteraceae bacterium]|nr:cytochrome P460 family protein [Candidatus Competibacteraceae bacterium]
MNLKPLASVCAGLCLAIAAAASAQSFGNKDDLAYAEQLWQALVKAGLAGKGAFQATPYPGQHPHGAVLQTLDGKVSVGGKSQVVIVKRNYGGEGVSKEAVADNPDKFLMAVTVMVKRPGYDPANKDWFWVKYTPNGKPDKTPEGTALAGRVGMCSDCHKSAPGGDQVFNHNRYK